MLEKEISSQSLLNRLAIKQRNKPYHRLIVPYKMACSKFASSSQPKAAWYSLADRQSDATLAVAGCLYDVLYSCFALFTTVLFYQLYYSQYWAMYCILKWPIVLQSDLCNCSLVLICLIHYIPVKCLMSCSQVWLYSLQSGVWYSFFEIVL